MKIGQVILIKNIERVGGRLQKSVIRPAIIRKVYEKNLIDVRLVSTIYVNGNVKVSTLEEAENALKSNFAGMFPHQEQYVIIDPKEAGVLNFSYVFGNMYTDIIDLNDKSVEIVVLKNTTDNKPLIISDNVKIKIEEKEIEAIVKNIIKQYSIEFKKVKEHSYQ